MATEQHQAPADVPKANRDLPLGMGIEINGEVITEAKVKFVGGLSPANLNNPPTRKGETRAYIVLATCDKHHVKEINGETVVEVDMRPYVVYDRDLGPFGDQVERGPNDVVKSADEPDADDAQGGLFDPEDPEDASADDADLPEGPEWGDAEARGGEPTKAFAGGPAFSAIDGAKGTEE